MANFSESVKMKRNSCNLFGSRPSVFVIKQTTVIQSTQHRLFSVGYPGTCAACYCLCFGQPQPCQYKNRTNEDNKNLRCLFLLSLTLERGLNTGRNM